MVTKYPLYFFKQHILQAIETAGIKFPDYKNSGVSLRSQRMKLPANVGQKKSKGIEQMLQDMGLGKFKVSFSIVTICFFVITVLKKCISCLIMLLWSIPI